MTIRGSFRDDPAWKDTTFYLMCVDTATQSGDKIQEIVRRRTPVLSGDLRRSVTQSPMTRQYGRIYRVRVSSTDLRKVRWIEHGTPPHEILPRRENGKTGALVFNAAEYSHVDHPGTEGVHMFSRGGSEFEELHAERIAESNLWKFLRARRVQ